MVAHGFLLTRTEITKATIITIKGAEGTPQAPATLGERATFIHRATQGAIFQEIRVPAQVKDKKRLGKLLILDIITIKKIRFVRLSQQWREQRAQLY